MTEHENLETVAVGFDGHERSEPAVSAAFELHRRLGSSVEVLHVSDIRDPHPERDPTGTIGKFWEEEATALRKRVMERVDELLTAAGIGDLDAEKVVTLEAGHPAQVLAQYAQRRKPDLIVLGPHEQRGIFDFGSTARALMAHTTSSLWVQPGPRQAIRRILVPTDLSEHSFSALRVARKLAAGFEASVSVLHCYVPPAFSYPSDLDGGAAATPGVIEGDREASREAFERKLADMGWHGAGHETRWLEGRPEEVILDQQGDCDLIVLGTHGRTGLAAALLGNVAYGVLRRSDVPVLAVRLPKHRWLLGSDG